MLPPNVLADDTLWTGVPGNYTDLEAPAALAVVRKLVDEGRFVDATKAASGLFGGPTEVCCMCEHAMVFGITLARGQG